MKFSIPNCTRQDQSSRVRIEAIRAALIKGEQSGKPQPFDPEQFKQEMREKHVNGTA